MALKPSSIADAYGVLGLEDGASLESIKIAYKQLALRTHPDKNPGNADATAQFQRLSEAYKVLLRSFETPSSPFFTVFSPFGEDDYDDDECYCEDNLDFYKYIFEEMMRGHAHYSRRRFYRPQETSETPEQYQTRVKRSREEQVAAEQRRKKEEAIRKERLERERQQEREEAEERQKIKASKKKAEAAAQRKKAEQSARNGLQRAQTLRSAVFAAARSGDAAKVKKGVWEDEIDPAGGEIRNGCVAFAGSPPSDLLETLLHISAKIGDVDLLKWLDAHSADPEERNGEGLTALHVALRHGHVTILKHFLENYPPKEQDSTPIYDLQGSNNTLLSLALESNEPEIVWMILDNGLSNAQDIANMWAFVSSSEHMQATKPSAKERENAEDIRNLLMRYGGFTPPNTPIVNSQHEDKSGPDSHRHTGGRPERRGIKNPPSEQGKPRQRQRSAGQVTQSSPPPESLPTRSPPPTKGVPSQQKPVNQGRGRGRGRGRGKGRGRSKGTA